MPRPNYGNAVKQRSANFFAVLLDYTNDDLEIEERRLEIFQREIQFNWQTERRCALRTKVRHLEDLCRLAGANLTGEQIKEAIKCAIEFLGIIEDNRTSKGGSETWHFTLNLWHDRFDRSANLQKFESEWERRKSGAERPPIEPEISTDEWWERARSSLVAQQYQRLTTNPLMDGARLKFSLDEVYIPLGLMPRTSGAADSQGREDIGEENVDRVIPDLDRFLEQIVSNSEPNRIGIIGAPGAGKTTCLQKLAAGLLDRQLLPIWISLADLQGETLENYLLGDWLKIATKQVIIEPKLQQEFATEFASGRVWLLLDAIDEMAIDASLALANLARQFRGWVGDAHIILTCRSHVWEGGKNPLEDFITYRNLGLSAERSRSLERVREFIGRWFVGEASRNEKREPELGEKLVLELAQPQYQRLREAIDNPLRLALLCGYWSRTQGKLPSTKAILYQQFTETIYEWKQDRFPTTLGQRQQLDLELGRLALAAIASNGMGADRFRLRLEDRRLGDPNLIELALQLGWLERVGICTRTGAKMYAFYHATFQEYFAARSITDWHYFFAESDNMPAPIFNPNWQETILFWFGRFDISHDDKEACIEALINFDRQGGGCYYYRAYFLAAAALAEFPESSHTTEIIDRLLHWRFAEYDPAENVWNFYPLPIQDGARVALRQTDRTAAIAGLERFIATTNSPFLQWQAAHSLGKIFDPGNLIATQALIDSLPLVSSGDLKIKICESLIKIAPNYSQLAIDTLVEIVESAKWTAIVRKAAFTLGKIALDPSLNLDRDRQLINLAIDKLALIIATETNREAQLAALENLRHLDPTHPTTHQQFTYKTLPSSTRNRRKKAPYPREIALAITELERKIASVNKPELLRRYAYQLGKFQPGHPLAVDTLLTLMSAPLPQSFYKRTGEYLKEIVIDEQIPLLITRLKDCADAIERGDRTAATLASYKLLWYCAERLSYSEFVRIWNDR